MQENLSTGSEKPVWGSTLVWFWCDHVAPITHKRSKGLNGLGLSHTAYPESTLFHNILWEPMRHIEITFYSGYNDSVLGV